MSNENDVRGKECEERSAFNYDWSCFERKVIVHADIETVYNAWTTSSGLESWFLKSAEFKSLDGTSRESDDHYAEGDDYRWTWFGYDGEELNQVLEANGKDRISFGFAQVCIVTVELHAVEDGVSIVLRQSAIPLNEEAKVNWHMGCSLGWVKYLMNLKSVLEGGSDLRRKVST